MTGTFNPVSEGNQRMRRWVCEPPFMEDLPPSSDRGALDPGRGSIKREPVVVIPPPAREVTGQWKDGGGGTTATTTGRLEGADAKPDNLMLLNYFPAYGQKSVWSWKSGRVKSLYQAAHPTGKTLQLLLWTSTDKRRLANKVHQDIKPCYNNLDFICPTLSIDDAETATNLKRKTPILLQIKSIFGANSCQIKKRETITLFNCGVCRCGNPFIQLQAVTVTAAKTGSPSFLLYSTQNDDWGSAPGNVQGHVRRTISHEHFDSPPFFQACLYPPSLRYFSLRPSAVVTSLT